MVGRLSVSYLKEDGREFIEVKGNLWNPPRRKYEVIQKSCKRCSTPLSRDVASCYNCRDLGDLDSVVALGYYIKGDTAKKHRLNPQQTSEDILRAKNNDDYSQVLGKALSVFLQKKRQELTNFDLVVPVPGSSKELEMAKEVSKTTGILLSRNCLVKYAGPNTSGMPPDLRKVEARRRIHGTDQKLNGQTVLLIDDVHTTSATASRCAHELKRMGAKQVVALVVGKDVTIPRVVKGRIVNSFIEEMLPVVKKPSPKVKSKYVSSRSSTSRKAEVTSSSVRGPSSPVSSGFYVGKSQSTSSSLSSLDRPSGSLYNLYCLKCGGQLIPVMPSVDSLTSGNRQMEFSELKCNECGKRVDISSIKIKIRPVMMGAGVPLYRLQCKTHRSVLKVTHKFQHTTRGKERKTWFFAFGFECSKGCKTKIKKHKFGCI
jgi:predicted amidophosphoribosyltransferase